MDQELGGWSEEKGTRRAAASSWTPLHPRCPQLSCLSVLHVNSVKLAEVKRGVSERDLAGVAAAEALDAGAGAAARKGEGGGDDAAIATGRGSA